jgi:hypothetical protein
MWRLVISFRAIQGRSLGASAPCFQTSKPIPNLPSPPQVDASCVGQEREHVRVAAVARAVQGRAAVAGRKVHIGTELVQQQFHDRRVATERREVERRLVRRACSHKVMTV